MGWDDIGGQMDMNKMESIKDYEGLYSITKDGRVYSFISNRFLKPAEDTKGYLRCGLSKNKKKITKKIHRLVAQAYLSNEHRKPQVNHKDGNKKNNKVENLEWATQEENMRHAVKMGLMPIQLGDLAPASKINSMQARVIKKILQSRKLTQNEIAEFFGISRGCVCDINIGRTWGHLWI